MMTVIHCDFSQSWRGGQQQLLLLARELRQIGCTQTLVAPYPQVADRFRDEGFAVERSRLAAVRLTRRADIIHAHDGHAHSWILAVRPFTSARQVLSRRVAFAITSRFSRWKYRHLDLVLAVSNYVRERVLEAGIPASRIAVVYDGVDLAALPDPKLRPDLRARLQLDDHHTWLVAASAFTAEKGLPDLFNALSTLPSQFHLLLAGVGEDERLVEAIAQHGLAERVRLAGKNISVAEAVLAGDIFVLPSREEGLGSAALVAMALARPVVATRTGGIPELVVHEDTGLLAPPADPQQLSAAILRMTDSPALAARTTECALRRVEREFSSAMMAAATERAYRKVLERTGG